MSYGELCRLFARQYGWTPEVIARMTPAQANMYSPDLGRVSPMNHMGKSTGNAPAQHEPDQWYDPHLKKMVRRGRRIGAT